MKSTFDRIINSLVKQKLSILVFLLIVLDVFLSTLFSHLLFPNHTAGPKFDNQFEAFILAVLLSPLVETYLFQYMLIGYIVKKFPNSSLAACLLSASIFGILHYYSFAYVLKTFISGFLYGILFLIASKKIEFPFIPVAIAHSIFNFIGFCIEFLL